MANRKVPTAPQPPLTSAPAPTPQEEQNQETGWTVLFRPLFWFLVLPGGVLLLVKWLLGY